MARIEKLTPALIDKGLSMRHTRNGNFVIIDHGQGEFSLSCHLQQNISVRAGDRV